MDRLQHPLREETIIEILRRNLRPEIRHEILNLKLDSVSRLREVCRRREGFLDSVRNEHAYQRAVPFRKHVAEILEEAEDAAEFSGVEEEAEIGAMALVCWNCRKEGHRYQDCGEKRKIFCYGCGARISYKPSCVKCQKTARGAHYFVNPRVYNAPSRRTPIRAEFEERYLYFYYNGSF